MAAGGRTPAGPTQTPAGPTQGVFPTRFTVRAQAALVGSPGPRWTGRPVSGDAHPLHLLTVAPSMVPGHGLFFGKAPQMLPSRRGGPSSSALRAHASHGPPCS